MRIVRTDGIPEDYRIPEMDGWAIYPESALTDEERLQRLRWEYNRRQRERQRQKQKQKQKQGQENRREQ